MNFLSQTLTNIPLTHKSWNTTPSLPFNYAKRISKTSGQQKKTLRLLNWTQSIKSCIVPVWWPFDFSVYLWVKFKQSDRTASDHRSSVLSYVFCEIPERLWPVLHDNALIVCRKTSGDQVFRDHFSCPSRHAELKTRRRPGNKLDHFNPQLHCRLLGHVDFHCQNHCFV